MSTPLTYLKLSRSPTRHATEIATLALIHNHPGGPPAPRLLAEWTDATGPRLELSYEPEANLADLLSPTSQAHPLPPWYQPTLLPVRPATADLLPLFAEVGRALKALHGIRVEQFGKLVGADPNPHQHDGKVYTLQEANHFLLRGREMGFLPSEVERSTRNWLERNASCLDDHEPCCLIHFDMHAANIRVERDPHGKWRLRCLYDFEMARGGVPEWDLVSVSWDLNYLEDDDGHAWRSFIEGYGPIHSERLRLLEVIQSLSVIAYIDHYSAKWMQFVLERIRGLTTP